MKYLTLLPLFFATLASVLPAADLPSRSLETDLSGSWAYADDFGKLGVAPGVAVTFGYAIGPSSQLGLTLVRFTPWMNTATPTYQVSYGLEYKHFWQEAWGNLGAWTPWASYSLLLDQTVRQGVEGRGMAHHTRLALGTDLAVFDRQHLTLEAGWAMASYASFGVAKAPSLSAVHLGAGWRVLF